MSRKRIALEADEFDGAASVKCREGRLPQEFSVCGRNMQFTVEDAPQPDRLLPCPFCGGEAEISEEVYEGPRCKKHEGVRHSQWWVYCGNKDCQITIYVGGSYETEQAARAAWNRRVTP